MLRRLGNRFLTRLAAPADTTEHLRVERVLAGARVFLTAAAMIAVYLDETEPNRYAELAYAILTSYFLWGIAVWLVAGRSNDIRRFRVWVHIIDIVGPMTFMLFTAGPNSPFFVFLLFVLVAASFRWGFPETVLTAIVVTGLMVLEASVLSYGPQRGWIAGQYEVNRFVIRISYLITFGLLVGYLGEEEKQWRAENAAITRLLALVHAENGMRISMQEVLTEIMRVFRAPRSLVVLAQAGSNRIFLWRMTASEGYAHSSEVEPEARPRYQFTIPASVVFAAKQENGWQCSAIGPAGRKIRITDDYDPARSIPESGEAKSVLAASINIGEEWSGSVLIYDAVVGPETNAELRFLQSLMRQIGPALYTVFLVRRLRSRAGAIERARVARELHDGAIQAFISVEMQIDVLRRQLESTEGSAEIAGRLQHVQEIVRQQVFELRMLMQQMRPVEFRPGQLLDFMADIVDRFRRDTGMAARFVTTLEDVQMPSRTGRELIRILQEALVNIRKHSGASNVQVRFGAADGCWKLGIVDNGRGFDFSGRMNLQEMDSAHCGPAILKERVRTLGGDLSVQSTPGAGCELSISLPQKAYSTYA